MNLSPRTPRRARAALRVVASVASSPSAAVALSALLAVAVPASAAAAPGARLAATELPASHTSDLSFLDASQGATPFIGFARFQGAALPHVTGVTFTIVPRAGATAAPVKVDISRHALAAHGYAPRSGPLTVPLFGFYAGETDTVSVVFRMDDGTRQSFKLLLPVPAWTDPHGVYDHPTVVTPRDPSVPLGYGYMYLKSGLSSPVILDVDGAVRWVGPDVPSSFSSTFVDGMFVIGELQTPGIYQMGLDGTLVHTQVDLAGTDSFNHNITRGRDALLAGVNTVAADGTTINAQSTIVEMTPGGHVLREWDFAHIIGDWMSSHGDDPTLFVRPGRNWLHLNAQLYDARDDSLVVSSREQFVMKVDYDTGAIRWIFGDPTKYWSTFPSLRLLALSGPQDGFYPIGQHGITLRSDGALMLFNNGAPTYDVPPGAPTGRGRPYSAVSAYRIDEAARTVTDVYRYDHDRTLKAAVCSSAWESAGGTMLVDFASAERDTHAHLVGLGPAGQVGFEYQYPTASCGTAWHAVPFPFESMSLK